MRQIRLKDLNRLYDFVVVVDRNHGERECHPRDVKAGEIVELPVEDGDSDYAFFEVLPDLVTSPAGVVEQLLSEEAHVGGTNAEGTLRIVHGPYPSAEAVPIKPNEVAWKSDPGVWWAAVSI